MLRIDYNPLLKRREEKNKALSEKTIKQIDDFYDRPLERGENLTILKRVRKFELKDGDIFLCSLNGKVYYYGKIYKAKIYNEKDPWVSECSMVCIFREKTTTKDLSNYKGDYSNPLGLFIVTRQYWTGGYFETIGNIPLTEEDRNLDYGFYKSELIGCKGCFCKETGEILDHIPKYFDGMGVTTLIGVYRALKREAIIDPSLLTMD